MTDRNIALDGPLSGEYIDADTAQRNDYELIEWSQNEQAYLHVPTEALSTDANGVPLEILQAEEAER